MTLDPHLLIQFREHIKRSREADENAWNLSRKLVTRAAFPSTLKRLAETIQSSTLPASLRDALVVGLGGADTDRIPARSAEMLRQLTGLPSTKAVRALCVFFGLVSKFNLSHPISQFSPADVERAIRTLESPFDLLLQADVVSALDLGAGDLSFAEELAQRYLSPLRDQGKAFTLHGVDRVHPGSQLGGALQPDSRLIERLSKHSPGLHFRYWGNQDMFELEHVNGIWPRYTIATCSAPATPTFAYEPTRLSPHLIDKHLRATKGEFRKIRFQREEALEVDHKGRALLFPPWKFEIRGPLALLDLLSRYGTLCVLASVDSQVFWEILSQLLADPALRPSDTIFDQSIIPELFGPLYSQLAGLPVGGSFVLSDLVELRSAIPRVLGEVDGSHHRFRFLQIRRGAVFEGIPCSRTARLFRSMTEEETPWFLVLIPER